MDVPFEGFLSERSLNGNQPLGGGFFKQSQVGHDEQVERDQHVKSVIEPSQLKNLLVQKNSFIQTHHRRNSSQNHLGVNSINENKQSGKKLCLEHNRYRDLICIDCKQAICETCPLFGSHKGHTVYFMKEMMDMIQKRTEILMNTFQNVENYCDEMGENLKINDAMQMFNIHKTKLKQKAQSKVDFWKKQLDDSLLVLNSEIDKNFEQYEHKIGQEKNIFDDLLEDGENQMTCIKEILDRTMSKMAMNSNYVAYEIMNKDPLNENSVEYLNGQ